MKSQDKFITKKAIMEDGGMITVKYGMSYHTGNLLPYFSITGSTKYIFGCIHDDIAKYFPELKPLIKWHLHDQNGVPMHYVENSLYWAQRMLGIYRVFPYTMVEPISANDKVFFEAYIHWGLFPEDTEDNYPPTHKSNLNLYGEEGYTGWESDLLKEVLIPWLKKRLAKIKAAFHADMEKFNIEYIDKKEAN